jgi:hypothetical protein
MVEVDSCEGSLYTIEGHVYGVTNVIPDHVEPGRSYLASFGSGGDWEDPEVQAVWQCDVVYGGTFLINGAERFLGDMIDLDSTDADNDGQAECSQGDAIWLTLDTSS